MADIKQAAKWLAEGKSIRRPDWFEGCNYHTSPNGGRIHLFWPDESSDLSLWPFDLLAEDWELGNFAMSKLVRVQIGNNGLPVHIYRDKSWRENENVQIMDRTRAVGAIRAQVYERSESENGWHECEACGRIITWESMEMHEKVFKGKGGEVSVENCTALCHQCHTGNQDSAHGDRRWHTSKLPTEGHNV